MVIEFKNEKELLDGILHSEIDIHEFAVLLFDRYGMTLNQRMHGKLMKVQEKNSVADDAFAKWKGKSGKIYTVHDIPKTIQSMVKRSTGKYFADYLYDWLGDFAPDHYWAKNFHYFRGDYYFNEDGLEQIRFRLLHKGYITQEIYDMWCK